MRILISTSVLLLMVCFASAQEYEGLTGENITLKYNQKTEFTLNESSIVNQLAEKSSTITLPFMGKNQEYTVHEYNIHAGNKNPFPEIRTYKFYDPANPILSGRITASPSGVFISFHSPKGLYRIYPDLNSEKRIYYHEYGIAQDENQLLNVCNQHGEIDYNNTLHSINEEELKSKLKRNGSTLREYRAAIICTGEYYQANGNSPTPVRTLAIANLADVSAIFEKDLAVQMVLATGSPRLETDPDNDPFIPDNAGGGSRTQQAEAAIKARFASARYDVGHVFHTHSSGDGWTTGGLAGLGVVCNDLFKARGWSGSFNNTGNGFIQLAAHEFGHQYNATHTFNGSGGSCTDNISNLSAYEIGSGTTIMSYQGLCDAAQNIPSSGVADNYFNINSLDRMVSFLEFGGQCNEVDWTPDNNNEPVVDANPCGAVYELPRLTPFFLTGSATDADGDVLTYCWEGYDEDGNPATDTQGLIGTDAANTDDAPLWRSFPPSLSPTRYFPNIVDVKNNFSSDFEALPRRNRAMKMRLTVRDNNPAGGAIDWEQITINVTSTIGPLQVTEPAAGIMVDAGSVLSVVWDTRNSESICTNADIKISFDGGITYPLTLAKDVDYAAGTADVTIPASFTNTDQARIMVACSDYECYQFYDLNNGNFTILSNCFAPGNLLCDTEYEEFDTNDPGLNLGLENIKGTIKANIEGEVANVPPTMPPAVNDFNGNCTRISSLNNAFDTIRFVVTESGSYTLNFNTNGTDFIKAYTIFDALTFQSNNGCASFIESNASFVSNNFTFFDFLTVDLEACKEYLLASQITNSNTRDINVSSISGPGFLLVQEPSPDFAATYLAIDANTDVIIALDDNSDFTFLSPGEYHIHSVYYKDGGIVPPDNIDPNDWIGLTTLELLNSGDCYNLSTNYKPIAVISTCTVNNIVFGNQSACDPMTNTYTQEISFDIDMGPGSGTVEINGESFLLSGDSFSGTMTNLISDGNMVNVDIIFPDLIACNTFVTNAFQAPVNCCPITLDLGDDIVACFNDDVTLDAGPDGNTYQWFKDGNSEAEMSRNYSVSEDGTYSVIVTDSNGCSKSDEISVSFNILPTLDLGNDILACLGDTVEIIADTQADSIVWYKDQVQLPNDNIFILEVTEPGEYEAVITNEFNCSVSLDIQATFSESPIVDFGADQTLCEGDTTILTAGAQTDIHIWTKDNVEITEFSNMLEVTENGTYGVTASNSNGCFDSDEIVIAFEPLPALDLGEGQELCEGETYEIVANAGGFTIEWFKNDVLIPDENDDSLVVDETGVYKAVVSAGVDCSIEDEVAVIFNTSPVVDLGDDQALCEGQTYTIDAGNPGETFVWTKDSVELPEQSNMLEVSENGVYGVTVTNGDDCSTTDEVSITFEDLPDLDLGEDRAFCIGQSFIIVTQTGGFNIEWYQDDVLLPEDDGTLSVTETGTYKAVIFSNMDCMVEDEIFIEFLDNPVVDLGEDAVLCEGETLTLDGGNPDNTYAWSKDAVLLAETGNTIDVTETGLYSVISTNAGNCTTEDEILVTFLDLPDLELGEDQILCTGENYELIIDASGFTIEWYADNTIIAGEDSDTLNVTTAGSYKVIVSAVGSNCSIEDEVVIDFLDSPIVDFGEDAVLCEGETLTLDAGDPDINYEWTKDAILLAETGNTLDVTENGVYAVTATNAGNCSTQDEIMVTFQELPVLDLGEDQLLCAGETFELLIDAGGFDIEWFKDDVVIAGENSNVLLVNTSADYKVVVSSAASNCSVEATVRIDFNESPVVDLGEDQLLCEGTDFLMVAGDQSNSYMWTLNTVDLMNDLNSYTATENGEYTVTATNGFDCSTSDTINIEFNPRPMIELGADQEFCQGADYVIVANTNGFDIQWSLNNNVLAGEVELELTTTESGQYIARVASGVDCFTSDTVNIVYNPVPDIELGADQTACEGEIITLDAGVTGIDFEWFQGGTSVQTSMDNTFEVSEAGEYVVVATNEFLCESRDTTNVNFITAPTVELEEDFEFCASSTATITSTSNVSSATWFLDGVELTGEENTEITVSEGGEYVVVVGTGNQCEDRDTIVLTSVADPDFMISGVSQECTGTDVTLTVDAEANETISWFFNNDVINNETDEELTVSETGTYSSTLVNTTGCESTMEIEVTFFDPPVNQLATVPNLCDGDMFTMIATSDGASFSWMDDNGIISGETGLELDISSSGDYTFIAENAIGCQTMNQFSVTFNPLPDAELGQDQMACIGETVLLNVEDQAGNTYEWTLNGNTIIGETSNELEVSAEGTYGLLVTSNNDCSAEDQVQFTFNTPPTSSFEDEESFCEGSSADLLITTDATEITWMLGGQVIATDVTSINVTQGGDYMIELSSDAGCTLTEQITVTEFLNPVVEIDDIELCPGESQDIDLDTGFDTYTWTGITASGPSTTIVHEDFGTTTTVAASVTVIDNNNCQTTDNFDITYNPVLNAMVADEDISLCLGETARLEVSGGLFYEWTDPNNSLSATDIPNPVASPVSSTSYTVTISDNCPNNMAEFTIELTVNTPPVANAGPDTCVVQGQLFELQGSGGLSYIWDNQEFIEGPFAIPNPVISIDSTTTFTVTVIDDNGCIDSDQVEVCIIDDPTALLDEVTIITPNGDGQNDELIFRGLEAFPDNKLTIFNRWGNIIYEKIGYQKDDARWSGLRDGVELPPDTYYYVLEFAGTKIKTSITILRD